VVGLVPHCGCEYLLLGVDVVCHCFCSPCCDLCAAAWVTVLCTVFVGVVSWCPYFILYELPSLREMFHYCFEYRIALYGDSVVYLVPIFGFSLNVQFFKGVEHFSLSLILSLLWRPSGRLVIQRWYWLRRKFSKVVSIALKSQMQNFGYCHLELLLTGAHIAIWNSYWQGHILPPATPTDRSTYCHLELRMTGAHIAIWNSEWQGHILPSGTPTDRGTYCHLELLLTGAHLPLYLFS